MQQNFETSHTNQQNLFQVTTPHLTITNQNMSKTEFKQYPRSQNYASSQKSMSARPMNQNSKKQFQTKATIHSSNPRIENSLQKVENICDENQNPNSRLQFNKVDQVFVESQLMSTQQKVFTKVDANLVNSSKSVLGSPVLNYCDIDNPLSFHTAQSKGFSQKNDLNPINDGSLNLLQVPSTVKNTAFVFDSLQAS